MEKMNFLRRPRQFKGLSFLFFLNTIRFIAIENHFFKSPFIFNIILY